MVRADYSTTFITLTHMNSASGLWGLVNNAGVCVYGEFDWLTKDQCDRQISVNLVGIINTTRSFMPLIRRAKGMSIKINLFVVLLCLKITDNFSVS